MTSISGLPRMMRPDQAALLAGRSVAGSGPAPQQNVLINPVIIITPGRGTFVYAPVPAAGNLIASIAAMGGTDRYGNAYLAGVVSYFNTGSWAEAVQLFAGAVRYWFAPSEAGPYSQETDVALAWLNASAAVSPFLDVGGSFGIGSAAAELIFYAPSGDTTGATDTAAINFALSSGFSVRLLPGVFFTNAPLVLASNQSLTGTGAHVTTITCKAASPITGMIIAGETAVVGQVTVAGMQLFGNSDSGHGVVWRASNSKLADMIIQDVSGDCLHIDPATVSGSAEQDVFFNILGITPGGNGVWSDKITDSDFYSVTMDGGPAGTLGGLIGFDITEGANLRFYGCHAYLFTNGGMQMSGSQHAMIGGELESNGIADLIVNGASVCTFGQVEFYDQANPSPPTQHIHVTGGASAINIANCSYYPATYVVPNFLIVDAGSNAWAHDCMRYNPTGLQTPPAYTSGSPTQNPFPFPVRVFAGGGATLTALNGTALGTPVTMLELGRLETVTPSGAGGSWQWFGL